MIIVSHFSLTEWTIVVLASFASALLNTYAPVKPLADYINIPGPATGMALLIGILFVFWFSLAKQLTMKSPVATVTSIVTASICIMISPWFGILSPPWFSIYGMISLAALGLAIEKTSKSSVWISMLGGAAGSLICLFITWIAFGIHIGVWVSLKSALSLSLICIFSGAAGIFLSVNIADFLKYHFSRIIFPEEA